MNSPPLDKKQAAKHLNICTDTLMAEVHAGRLIGFKIRGRWRFDTRDLDNYIDTQRQNAAIEADMKSKRQNPQISI